VASSVDRIVEEASGTLEGPRFSQVKNLTCEPDFREGSKRNVTPYVIEEGEGGVESLSKKHVPYNF